MLNKFNIWYNNIFKLDPLYKAMEVTSEDSPYHRERTVAVHTDMVVSEYLGLVSYYNSINPNPEFILGAFAAAFHDVGKPVACTPKHNETRGNYKSFAGHEGISARLWEDWAVRNWDMLCSDFNLTVDDIYIVGIMIEYHKPWDLTKQDKLSNLSLTMMHNLVDNVFDNLVIADTWGRISDDQEEKRAKVLTWVEAYRNRNMSLTHHSSFFIKDKIVDNPTLYVPIAASGTGKSTVYHKHYLNTDPFSLDLMRHELYPKDDYATAWMKSTKDNHFKPACNDRYKEMLRTQRDIYLDNTNTLRKVRAHFIQEARRYGYSIVAVLMPVDIETIVKRQTTRGDKNVPAEEVRKQYMRLQLPQYTEVDNVIVYDYNLVKK